MGMMTAFVQGAMLSLGPFFCYPLKPQLNLIFGSSYADAFRHFRRDHTTPTNIGCHLVCLVFQLMANFSLLRHLDETYILPNSAAISAYLPFISIPPSFPLLSLISVVCWIIALVPTASPVICPILSVVCVLCAYATAPLVVAVDLEMLVMISFVMVMLLGEGLKGLLPRGLGLGNGGGTLKAALIFAAYWRGWHYMETHYHGVYAEYTVTVSLSLVAALFAVASFAKEPLKPTVILGSVSCRLCAVLTGSPILWYWSMAFTASICQGISHHVCGEYGTLEHLDRDSDKEAKARFEWAHVVYFPNILWQTALERVGVL